MLLRLEVKRPICLMELRFVGFLLCSLRSKQLSECECDEPCALGQLTLIMPVLDVQGGACTAGSSAPCR
jgi:hypothetical protein